VTMPSPKSLIDALQASFAGAFIPTLMKAVPELYVLGPYAPEKRQGPVIWLKCFVERTLPDVSPPAGVVPILYLPNVSRQDLRAGGDCPQTCSRSSSSSIAAPSGIAGIGRWAPFSPRKTASASTLPEALMDFFIEAMTPDMADYRIAT
jgi:hypothetical protein